MKTLHWTPGHATTTDASSMADDTMVMHRPFADIASAAAALPDMTLPMPVRAPVVEDSGIREKAYEEAQRSQATRQATPQATSQAEHVAPAPRLDVMKLNKLVVSSYKLMGFAVLGAILLGLASFLFTNLFYMVNHGWVTPMVVSSTDPRVLQLESQVASQKAARDAVATQRLQMAAQLEDARRVQASETRFQVAFQEAMVAEARDRGGELAGLQRLLADLRRTRADVASTSREYTAVSKQGLKDEVAAGLIDKDEATRGGYELSQIAGANLALHEKHVELDARIAQLARAVASLRSGRGETSYEVLHMRHELDASVLASEKAEGEAEAIAKSIAMLDATVAEYDAQLAHIARAPYLQAADKSVTTAFVPYDNVSEVKVGDPIYACAVSVLWCRPVGRVAELLEGEVVEKHPLHNRELRGILVRLAVDDPRAVERPVLHLRHAPVGI